MSSNDAIRLVCFDLGGVIVRICRTWEEGCRAAGLDVRELPLTDELRLARRDLLHAYEVGAIDRASYGQQHSELIEGRYAPEEVLAIEQAWLLGEYDGVDRLIDHLHARAVPTAALSNTNEGHWSQMDHRYPTVNRLQQRLASHLLGMRKPNREIFEAAESHFGVPGSAILYFDDLDDNIHAATAAGWRAHQIDYKQPTAPQIERSLRDYALI
ncbi:MAG: hypothetical protein EA377_06635 [Phycisphaerales bacterium]|nr:MAG: hypothetical protein EA377_06635 [Phycisphaerales bacterium]